MGTHHFSLRYCGQSLIRHGVLTKFLGSNDDMYKCNIVCQYRVYDSLRIIIECTKAVWMCLMWASMEGQWFFSLDLGNSYRLCGDIKLYSNNRPPFITQMVAIKMLLCTQNQHQRSMNDLWPCILENSRALRRHLPIIKLSATFLGKTCCDNITAIS
jgi:hypothetical protein